MADVNVMEEIKELQQIELSILLDVKEVCKKHNIMFFLGEGTMIGAVRHHGFWRKQDPDRWAVPANTGYLYGIYRWEGYFLWRKQF